MYIINRLWFQKSWLSLNVAMKNILVALNWDINRLWFQKSWLLLNLIMSIACNFENLSCVVSKHVHWLSIGHIRLTTIISVQQNYFQMLIHRLNSKPVKIYIFFLLWRKFNNCSRTFILHNVSHMFICNVEITNSLRTYAVSL